MGIVEIGKELPVGLNVYMITTPNREVFARAADYRKPTLVFDPFYERTVREFSKLSGSHEIIRQKLLESASIPHLDEIADTLDKQRELFLDIKGRFKEFYNEERMPLEFVARFFRNAVLQYNKFTFSQQEERLEQLKKNTGQQLDVLESLKTKGWGNIEELIFCYERLEKAVAGFAYSVKSASVNYDAMIGKLDVVREPITKFGPEPVVNIPEGNNVGVNGFIFAAKNLAQDPIFMANIERAKRNALEEIHLLAELVRVHSK